MTRSPNAVAYLMAAIAIGAVIITAWLLGTS